MDQENIQACVYVYGLPRKFYEWNSMWNCCTVLLDPDLKWKGNLHPTLLYFIIWKTWGLWQKAEEAFFQWWPWPPVFTSSHPAAGSCHPVWIAWTGRSRKMRGRFALTCCWLIIPSIPKQFSHRLLKVVFIQFTSNRTDHWTNNTHLERTKEGNLSTCITFILSAGCISFSLLTFSFDQLRFIQLINVD